MAAETFIAGYSGTLSSITTQDANEDLTIDPNGTGRVILQGNVGVGTTSPDSLLTVDSSGYLQFKATSAGNPPAGDCDSDSERGRLVIDTTNNRLMVCNGAVRGWDRIALTN